jgi:hypothetical protein
VGYGVVASVVGEINGLGFVVSRERRDLHAGIPTRNYEYFVPEIGESVGMESHVQNEYLSQCVMV